MTAPSGSTLRPQALAQVLAMCGGLGYLAAIGIVLAAWHVFDAQRSESAMSRLGAQLADDLAYHAVQPMMLPDRIRLGLLANRVVKRPEVRSVEMYSVDGTPLVIEGNARPDGSAYVSQVAIQNTVAGHVRVTLHAEHFRLPISLLVMQAWLPLAAGLVLTIGLIYFGGRIVAWRRRPLPPETPPPDEPDRENGQIYLLLATLFRPGVSHQEREDLLRHGMSIAERVANLYAGDALDWSDDGVALAFQATTSFEVVCAAILVQRLLNEQSATDVAPAAASDGTPGAARDVHRTPGRGNEKSGDSASPPFRLALDLVEDGWLDRPESIAQAQPGQILAVLASLAPNGGLVIGNAAFAAIDEPERVELRAFENPAVQVLLTEAAPRGIVTGTDDNHEALIARQAELIAATGP